MKSFGLYEFVRSFGKWFDHHEMSASSRNSMVKQQQEEEGVAADVMDVHTTSATGDELMSAAREVVGKAKADLFQRRLSVREMASQFERGQAAAHAAAASTLAHDVCTHVHTYPTHQISFVFCLSFIAIIGFSSVTNLVLVLVLVGVGANCCLSKS